MSRNDGRRFGEGMGQDSRIRRLTDDLAISASIVLAEEWVMPAPEEVPPWGAIDAARAPTSDLIKRFLAGDVAAHESGPGPTLPSQAPALSGSYKGSVRRTGEEDGHVIGNLS